MERVNVPIECVHGDITTQKVDAIVNAAKSSLLGGGGVDGAIHAAGGPSILAECHELGGCETGDAKSTTGGNLSAKYIIHTVGPVYMDGKSDEPEFLANCYTNSMRLADDLKCRTIAFPAISCGVYGYPIQEASKIAIESVRTAFIECSNIELIRFVLFSNDVFEFFLDSNEM